MAQDKAIPSRQFIPGATVLRDRDGADITLIDNTIQFNTLEDNSSILVTGAIPVTYPSDNFTTFQDPTTPTSNYVITEQTPQSGDLPSVDPPVKPTLTVVKPSEPSPTIQEKAKLLPDYDEEFTDFFASNINGITADNDYSGLEVSISTVTTSTSGGSGTSGAGAPGKNGRLGPGDLKSVPSYPHHKLAPAAADAMEKMLQAMPADIRKQVQWTDSYRPIDVQNAIFDWDRYVKTGGSLTDTTPNRKAERKKIKTNVNAAFPGTSNHGLGLAIDIYPAAVQNWIKKNGVNYGWSWTEGKAAGENWHFTYLPKDKRVYVK